MSTLDHNEASENYIEDLNNEREDDWPVALWRCMRIKEGTWLGSKTAED